MKYEKLILIIVALGAFTFFGAVASIEIRNPFSPHIDTVFARNFSIDKFKQIQSGMIMSEVINLVGQPIYKTPCEGCWAARREGNVIYEDSIAPETPCKDVCKAEQQEWVYSHDGACTWWDFAWEEFSVAFDGDKVSKTWNRWHYD